MSGFRLNRRAASVERQSFRKPIGRFTKAFRRRANIVDDDMKAQALLDYLKEDGIAPEEATVDEITVIEDGKMFGYDGYEYIVGTSDEAHDWAIEDVKNLWDDIGFQSFSEDFQEQVLDNDRLFDMNRLQEIMDEDIENYVNEFTEDELDEYCDTYHIDPEDKDDDEKRSLLMEAMTESYDSPVQYFRDMFGEKEFSDFIVEQGLLDVDAIAEEVVRVDGCANSLAGYDSKEIDLGNDLYAYRWN